MQNNKYLAAKKIMDFYQNKLEADDRKQAQFALQYSGLQMARYRMSCLYDSLTSYPLEVESE